MEANWEKAYFEGCLILRDHLAYHRTALANLRTLMAFVRTALALIIAGLSFLEFFGAAYMKVIAWVFIPTGVATMIVGVAVYFIMRGKTKQVMDAYAATPAGVRKDINGNVI